jgi:hypothetical protein
MLVAFKGLFYLFLTVHVELGKMKIPAGYMSAVALAYVFSLPVLDFAWLCSGCGGQRETFDA